MRSPRRKRSTSPRNEGRSGEEVHRGLRGVRVRAFSRVQDALGHACLPELEPPPTPPNRSERGSAVRRDQLSERRSSTRARPTQTVTGASPDRATPRPSALGRNAAARRSPAISSSCRSGTRAPDRGRAAGARVMRGAPPGRAPPLRRRGANRGPRRARARGPPRRAEPTTKEGTPEGRRAPSPRASAASRTRSRRASRAIIARAREESPRGSLRCRQGPARSGARSSREAIGQREERQAERLHARLRARALRSRGSSASVGAGLGPEHRGRSVLAAEARPARSVSRSARGRSRSRSLPDPHVRERPWIGAGEHVRQVRARPCRHGEPVHPRAGRSVGEKPLTTRSARPAWSGGRARLVVHGAESSRIGPESGARRSSPRELDGARLARRDDERPSP